jgi:dUTP pyrophosphatase
MKLLIKKICSDVIVPSYGSSFAAGLDLHAYGDHLVEPNQRKLISTGLYIQWVATSSTIPEENPDEYYLRIAPRSGLSVKNSIDIGAGVIDSDYRGEIKICLINNSNQPFQINHGDRIAQGILERIKRFESIEIVDDLTETERGHGGFGSTGK